MGLHIIKMPDIGEGIAEVEVVAWRVQPGDTVLEDQILADVMTDKATIEIPSPVQGRVQALGGRAGELMAVGAELIRIEVPDQGNVVQPAPAAVPLSSPAAAEQAPGAKPLASPAVRRRARELDIDLQSVSGSAPGGRIVQQDLDDFAASAPVGRSWQRHDEQAVPVIGLRRKIAQKMQEAKRRIPHFTYVEEIDMTELENLRTTLNAKWSRERGHLTLLPFVLRAMVLALREFPQINARYDDEAGIVTQYGAVHIGVATQTDSGLIVPVLRHAEALGLWDSAAAIARLAEAARSGKAKPADLSGSTITLTSLGRLGGIMSTPVINHPEVAIVGVNRMVQRPVVREAAIVLRQMMNLSSSFDHRVVDGMHAAEFIQTLRGYLECPATLFTE